MFRETWQDIGNRIGLPESLEPTPFPLPPLPKLPLYKVNGLEGYKAYALVDSTLEYLGKVYGKSEEEALEAAENIMEVEGRSFDALKVVEE